MNIRKFFKGIGITTRAQNSGDDETVSMINRKNKEKDEGPSVIRFLVQYWQDLPLKYKFVIVTTSISGLVTSILTTGTLALVVATIERLIGNESGPPSIAFLQYIHNVVDFLGIEPRSSTFITLTVVLAAVQISLTFLSSIFANHFIQKYSEELKNNTNNKIINSSWPFFLKTDTGTLFNMFFNLSTVYASFIGNFGTLLRFVFSSVIYAFPIILISWEFGIFVIGAALLAVPLSTMSISRMKKIGKETTELQRNLTKNMQSYYAHSKIVKSAGSEKKVIHNVSGLLGKTRELNVRSGYIGSITNSFRTVTSLGILVGGAAFGILVLNVDPTELLATVLLLSRLYANLSQSSTILNSVSISTNSAFRYTQMLKEAEEYQEITGGREVLSITESIELSNVSFAYEKGKLVLDDVSIKIPKGKLVAFVGTSGSGKTTTLDIIMRLLNPSSGKILLDGKDIGTYDITSWRKYISYVAQGFPMFSDTIANNLRWYKPDATDKEILDVCKLAGVNFIDELKDGLETTVGGSQGVGLSGGQRQRLAIAQALIRDSDITILDESTSETDLDTEVTIYKNILQEIKKGKTFIISAHRLVPTFNADLIYVFSEGKIVESGSPQDLLEQKGVYHRLWQRASRPQKTA